MAYPQHPPAAFLEHPTGFAVVMGWELRDALLLAGPARQSLPMGSV